RPVSANIRGHGCPDFPMKWTILDVDGRVSSRLLISGFGVRVPGGSQMNIGSTMTTAALRSRRFWFAAKHAEIVPPSKGPGAAEMFGSARAEYLWFHSGMVTSKR